jgi:anti-anti-sigma regulatory factor
MVGDELEATHQFVSPAKDFAARRRMPRALQRAGGRRAPGLRHRAHAHRPRGGGLGAERRPRLVLELSQLTFYDSTALGILAHTRQRVHATATGRMVFVGLPAGLRHLLQRTGLLSHFALHDSVEQAVADLLPVT